MYSLFYLLLSFVRRMVEIRGNNYKGAGRAGKVSFEFDEIFLKLQMSADVG
jgi:hypothetical protein